MSIFSFVLGCYVGGVVGLTLGVFLMAMLVGGKQTEEGMARKPSACARN